MLADGWRRAETATRHSGSSSVSANPVETTGGTRGAAARDPGPDRPHAVPCGGTHGHAPGASFSRCAGATSTGPTDVGKAAGARAHGSVTPAGLAKEPHAGLRVGPCLLDAAHEALRAATGHPAAARVRGTRYTQRQPERLAPTLDGTGLSSASSPRVRSACRQPITSASRELVTAAARRDVGAGVCRRLLSSCARCGSAGAPPGRRCAFAGTR
jgi:hypothetical protein